MMGSNFNLKVRSMNLDDLDAILLIDRKIRELGKAITYANLTTERIFTMDRKASGRKRPISNVDLITGDVTELLEWGIVADVEGHVRGFILGQIGHVGEAATEVGVILILGVHPDDWRKGIALALVSALCKKFRSRGIKTAHIGIDQRDKDLLAFFERLGFSVGHLIDYSKTL